MNSLYDFNIDAYKVIEKIVKFKFLKQIQNSGIVFQEVLFATNLITKNEFHILICNDQERIFNIRFKTHDALIIQLVDIAKKRLEKLINFENYLLKISDTDSYGESQYFNDTEMTAIGIESLKELIPILESKIS